MTTNKKKKPINALLAVNKLIQQNPTHSDCVEALKALSEYTKLREFIEGVFRDERRSQQIEQYFIVRRLLEVSGIEFPNSSKINQSEAVKQFNLSWQGNKTARLYWSVDQGWTVEHKDFDKELTGVWEGFSLEENLEANQIYFDEYEDD